MADEYELEWLRDFYVRRPSMLNHRQHCAELLNVVEVEALRARTFQMSPDDAERADWRDRFLRGFVAGWMLAKR